MRWKLTLILLIFVLLTPKFVWAANTSDLQRQIESVRLEREALLAEQKKLQAELDAVNKESQTLGAAVKSLDVTKKKLAADINVTKSKITSTSLTIQSLENSMTEKEQQIGIHRQAIAKALTTFSEYDSRPLILNLLSSAHLSDIWKDTTQLESLNTHLKDEINALQETKKILSQEKEEKEKVKAEQLSLQGQLSGQKLVVEENQKAKAQLLAETKNKEAEYQKLIQANIARQKESEADLYRLETELAITLDPSLFPAARPGVLAWPLDNIYVTGRFGKTVGGQQLYAQGFHNGVDFRASMGTPVKTMMSGTVLGTDNTDKQRGCYSYGRWILIKHPNGLTSLYAHLSAALVTAGQTVTTGQIIGYSGGAPGADGAGYSTGPHLHVGLFASQGVEISQFTTSMHCQQVTVPIAKGTNAYLDALAYLPAL